MARLKRSRGRGGHGRKENVKKKVITNISDNDSGDSVNAELMEMSKACTVRLQNLEQNTSGSEDNDGASKKKSSNRLKCNQLSKSEKDHSEGTSLDNKDKETNNVSRKASSHKVKGSVEKKVRSHYKSSSDGENGMTSKKVVRRSGRCKPKSNEENGDDRIEMPNVEKEIQNGQTNSLNSRRNPHNNFTEEASLSDTDMEINEAPRKINRHITKHIPAKGDADSLRNSSDVDTIANKKVTQQSGKHEANNIRRNPHNNFTEEASLSDTDMEINEAPRKINRHITNHIPAKGDADSLRNSSDVDTIANQKVTQQSEQSVSLKEQSTNHTVKMDEEAASATDIDNTARKISRRRFRSASKDSKQRLQTSSDPKYTEETSLSNDEDVINIAPRKINRRKVSSPDHGKGHFRSSSDEDAKTNGNLIRRSSKHKERSTGIDKEKEKSIDRDNGTTKKKCVPNCQYSDHSCHATCRVIYVEETTVSDSDEEGRDATPRRKSRRRRRFSSAARADRSYLDSSSDEDIRRTNEKSRTRRSMRKTKDGSRRASQRLRSKDETNLSSDDYLTKNTPRRINRRRRTVTRESSSHYKHSSEEDTRQINGRSVKHLTEHNKVDSQKNRKRAYHTSSNDTEEESVASGIMNKKRRKSEINNGVINGAICKSERISKGNNDMSEKRKYVLEEDRDMIPTFGDASDIDSEKEGIKTLTDDDDNVTEPSDEVKVKTLTDEDDSVDSSDESSDEELEMIKERNKLTHESRNRKRRPSIYNTDNCDEEDIELKKPRRKTGRTPKPRNMKRGRKPSVKPSKTKSKTSVVPPQPEVVDKLSYCAFCHRGKEVEPECGVLHQSSPYNFAAHHKCMQYSAGLVQYKTSVFGGFEMEEVVVELKRGRRLRCHKCNKVGSKMAQQSHGATAGCAIQRCSKTFHFYCAAVDQHAITARMEAFSESSMRKSVKYRIFCGTSHQREYERNDPDRIVYIDESLDDESEYEETSLSSAQSGAESEQPSTVKNILQQRKQQQKPNIKTRGQVKKYDSSSSESLESTRKKRILKKSKFTNCTQHIPKAKRTQRHSVSDDDGTLAQNMAQCSRKELREAAARHIVQPIANIIQKTINEGQPLVGDDASHNTQSADDEDVKQSPAGDVDPVRGSKEVEQTTNNGRLKQSDKNRKLDTGDKDEKGSGVNAVGQTAKDVKPENKDIVLCFSRSDDAGESWRNVCDCVCGLHKCSKNNVYLWRYGEDKTLTVDQMLYLIKDLAKSIRKSDVAQRCYEVEHLIFHLSDLDIKSYDRHISCSSEYDDNDVKSMIIANVKTKIKEDFSSVNDNADGETFASFVKVPGMQHSIVAMVLSDVIDPCRRIRDTFTEVPHGYSLDIESELLCTSNEYMDINREASIVQTLLDESINGRYVVTKHPADRQLLSQDNNNPSISCVTKLYQYFHNQKHFKYLANHIIFLGPVNTTVIDYKQFVQLYISSLTHKLLTGECDLYFIVSTKQLCDVDCVADILPDMPGHVNVDLYSAFDPTDQDITCLVVKVSITIATLEEKNRKERICKLLLRNLDVDRYKVKGLKIWRPKAALYLEECYDSNNRELTHFLSGDDSDTMGAEDVIRYRKKANNKSSCESDSEKSRKVFGVAHETHSTPQGDMEVENSVSNGSGKASSKIENDDDNTTVTVDTQNEDSTEDKESETTNVDEECGQLETLVKTCENSPDQSEDNKMNDSVMSGGDSLANDSDQKSDDSSHDISRDSTADSST